MGAVAAAIRAAGTAANPHTQHAGVDTAVDWADTAGIATVRDVAAGASDSSIRSGIRILGIHIPGSTTATTIRTLMLRRRSPRCRRPTGTPHPLRLPPFLLVLLSGLKDVLPLRAAVRVGVGEGCADAGALIVRWLAPLQRAQ